MIEKKPKRFDVFQNLKWNVSIYSKNFGTKPKLFDVFQFFILQKQNVSIYSKNFGTKPKRIDVFQNLKWNVSIYSKNFGTKPRLFDVFQLFFSKSKTLLCNPKNFEQNQNVFI